MQSIDLLLVSTLILAVVSIFIISYINKKIK